MNIMSLTVSRGLFYFRRWLAPPVFDDEDKTRTAAIFNTLILPLVALLLGTLAVRVILHVANPRIIPIGLILCALLLSIREIARRGYVRFAIMLFCSVLLLGISLGIYNNGTVRAMGTAAMIICVVVPTILVGSRTGLIFLGLTVAVTFGLAQAEIAGVLPPSSPPTLSPTSQWITLTAIILFHWGAVGVARNSMTEALTRIRHENTARQHAEENLRELNALLETRVAERTAELEAEILERKQVEESLRQSEARIRYILDNMTEGGQIISHDWRYLYVNEAVAIQGRHTPQELLDHTMLEMYPGIETTELFAALQHCMEDRIHHHMLNEFTFPDGSQGWFELSIQPVPEGIFILSNDVTTRKRAEELLRESEERYRDLVEISPNAILVQSEGQLVFVNPTALKLLGAAHSGQLVGKSMWKHIHPDYHQIVRENIRKFAEAQRIAPQEEKYIRLDGSAVDVEVIATPLVYQNQPAIQVIAQDITERKQAQEILRASEEKLRALFDTLSEGVALNEIIYDENGEMVDYRILEVNKAFYTIADYDVSQVIGNTATKLYGMSSELIKSFWEGHKNMSGTIYTEMLSPLNNKTFFIATSPFTNDKFVTSFLDITERKQAETVLQEKESQIRALGDNLPNGYVYQFDMGLDGTLRRFVYISAGVEKLFGISARQGLDDPLTIHERFMEEDNARVAAIEASALASMTPFAAESRYRNSNGHIRWMLIHSTPRKLENNHIVWDGFALDITERKQAEERQTILYETLHAVGAHLDSDAAASAAVEVLGRLGNWASVAISVANLDGQTWTTHAGTGMLVGRFGQPRSMDQGVIGRAYRTGQMQLVPDVSADPDYFAGTDQPVLIRSELTMPIKHGDQVLGMLNLESDALDAFSLEDISLAESLTGAMTLAFEKARLYALAQQEITERKQAEESLRTAHSQLQTQLAQIEELHIELRDQAIRDPLTGLYNRRYLFEALAQEAPRAIRGGYPISIILLDIDKFKIINDSFGHDAGDKVLQVLAAQLQALSRAEDIVCRYGGDEHLIVMHNTTTDKAVERADQLRKAIAKKSVSHADKSFQFTCSFGVAVFPVHAVTIEETISLADRALYQSKELGRNRVTLL